MVWPLPVWIILSIPRGPREVRIASATANCNSVYAYHSIAITHLEQPRYWHGEQPQASPCPTQHELPLPSMLSVCFTLNAFEPVLVAVTVEDMMTVQKAPSLQIRPVEGGGGDVKLWKYLLFVAEACDVCLMRPPIRTIPPFRRLARTKSPDRQHLLGLPQRVDHH